MISAAYLVISLKIHVLKIETFYQYLVCKFKMSFQKSKKKTSYDDRIRVQNGSHKMDRKKEVLPGVEPGLLDSKSRVITVRP